MRQKIVNGAVALLMMALFIGIIVMVVLNKRNEAEQQIAKDSEYRQSQQSGQQENHTLINASGDTLESRILVPEGYERTQEPDDSLGTFLRNYAMLPDQTPVHLYDGEERKHASAAAVFDMYLGDRNLQQCADSVMRIYAEYLRTIGREDKIAFHFVDGFLCDWESYKNGKRVKFVDDVPTWKESEVPENLDEAFEDYLNIVFAYSSTLSQVDESDAIPLDEIQIGDIFIKGGSPGHVILVADMCEKDGKKAFLLAQGFMPAQQFHVLKNLQHEEDPWYYEDEITYPFVTPDYQFDEECLKRPRYLSDNWP